MFATTDKNTISYLYERYFRCGCTYAEAILKNDKEAEDVVQNFFIKLYRKDYNFPGIMEFESFYYRSIRNSCIDFIRKNKETDSLNEEQLIQSAEFSLIEREIKEKLYTRIENLPRMKKKIIKLRLNNYNLSEIAEELKISYETVKSHNKQIMKILREDFKIFHYFFIFN